MCRIYQLQVVSFHILEQFSEHGVYHSHPNQVVIPIQVPEADGFDSRVCTQYCERDAEGVERPQLGDRVRHDCCVKAIAVDQWMDLRRVQVGTISSQGGLGLLIFLRLEYLFRQLFAILAVTRFHYSMEEARCPLA